jgi:hypothetical protein
MEADIRIIVATFTGLAALAAVSAQAAPLPPAKISAVELGACPMEQAAHELGSGSRPVPCSEPWGHCHSDRCFPMDGDNLYRPQREANWLD